VTEQDIAKAMMDQNRISIDAKLLDIQDGPIKKTGTYTVHVQEGSYKSEFTLSIL
jgi:ribosomal protein L9